MRAPGAVSGPRIGERNVCIPQGPTGRRSVEPLVFVGGDDEHDLVLLGEQLVGRRGARAGDGDDHRHVDRGERAPREAEIGAAQAEPGEPPPRDRLEAARS